MRGEKHMKAYLRECAERITPACAGKRAMTNLNLKCDQDHPRMRGEKPSL